MIPDDVEKIIMTKEDYDRNVEQLLLEKIELQERIETIIEALEFTKQEMIKGNINMEWQIIDDKEIDHMLKILKGEENEISNK